MEEIKMPMIQAWKRKFDGKTFHFAGEHQNDMGLLTKHMFKEYGNNWKKEHYYRIIKFEGSLLVYLLKVPRSTGKRKIKN